MSTNCPKQERMKNFAVSLPEDEFATLEVSYEKLILGYANCYPPPGKAQNSITWYPVPWQLTSIIPFSRSPKVAYLLLEPTWYVHYLKV